MPELNSNCMFLKLQSGFSGTGAGGGVCFGGAGGGGVSCLVGVVLAGAINGGDGFITFFDLQAGSTATKKGAMFITPRPFTLN